MRAPKWMATHPHILERMIEYLGGATLAEATAVFISRCDHRTYFDFDVRPPGELPFYVSHGLDIARSLWDDASLPVHFEIDYINFDVPATAYLDPQRTFALQQPVVSALKRLFLEFRLAPLQLVTGRGHHFVWRIPRRSRCLQSLRALGRIPPPLREIYHQPQPPNGKPVPDDLAEGFAGLGLVLEYLAHRLQEEAAAETEVPIRLTEVETRGRMGQRETISIDISAYGDPLHTRTVRIPFSVYRKPWEKGLATDPLLAGRLPQLFAIPLAGEEIFTAVQLMRDPERVAQLAGSTSTKIPSQARGMTRLVAAYLDSDLKKFHDWFYSQEHDPPEQWPETYDQLPMEAVPPCIRHILRHPNDLLLKPIGLQQVVRAFLAIGWHPRHIAGVVRSKFERDYGWGEQWNRYDPGTRADFYTRVFAGLIIMGGDNLDDFTCAATKERQFCFHPEESCDFAAFRRSLLERKKHGRLGDGPFNRLFLPA